MNKAMRYLSERNYIFLGLAFGILLTRASQDIMVIIAEVCLVISVIIDISNTR